MTDAPQPSSRRERRLAQTAESTLPSPALTRREARALTPAAAPQTLDTAAIDLLFAAPAPVTLAPRCTTPAAAVVQVTSAPDPEPEAEPELLPEPVAEPVAPAPEVPQKKVVLAGFDAESELASEEPVEEKPRKGRRKPKRPAKTVPRTRRRAKVRWWQPIARVIVIVLAAALITVLVKAFAFRTFTIPSESMNPTLVTGDHILVELVTPHFDPYKRGDVVVFTDPADWLNNGGDPDGSPSPLQLLGLVPEDSGYLVKRVIGTPGQTVEGLADGTVLVDGVPIEEPYAVESPQDTFTWVLGESEYWMMGDNRPVSADSRMNGPVSADHLVGRAVFTFLPWERQGPVE